MDSFPQTVSSTLNVELNVFVLGRSIWKLPFGGFSFCFQCDLFNIVLCTAVLEQLFNFVDCFTLLCFVKIKSEYQSIKMDL